MTDVDRVVAPSAAAKKKEKKSARLAKAAERRERKLFDEQVKNSNVKCDDARRLLYPTGKASEPNYTKARAALDAAVELYNDNVDAHVLIGECCRAQGQFNDAISKYTKALEIDPASIRALEGRGACFFALNAYANASEDYSSVVDIDPENDHAYNMRGLCVLNGRVPNLRLHSSKFDSCVSDFKNAIRLNEANYYALANLARAYEEQGDLDSAVDYFTRALRVKDDYSYARLRRSCVALRIAEGIHDDMHSIRATTVTSSTERKSDPALIAGATQSTYADVERELQVSMQLAARQQRSKKLLHQAIDDLTALLHTSMGESKLSADPEILLNLATCHILLSDKTNAEKYIKHAEEVIASNPSLVEKDEAKPIDNLDLLISALKIKKAEVLSLSSLE